MTSNMIPGAPRQDRAAQSATGDRAAGGQRLLEAEFVTLSALLAETLAGMYGDPGLTAFSQKSRDRLGLPLEPAA